MAHLQIEPNAVVVSLSALEKVGAFHGDVRVPLEAIRAVRVAEDPTVELRGIRAPGTGIPGLIALGSRRGGNGHDFTAIYHERPAVVLELEGAEFDRLVITVDDPAEMARRISDAAPRLATR